MYMIGRVSRYLNADHGLSKVRRAPHPQCAGRIPDPRLESTATRHAAVGHNCRFTRTLDQNSKLRTQNSKVSTPITPFYNLIWD
jgi:hypothetical protein